MGVVNPERYDAFFSYAHDDNKIHSAWIQAFHLRLSERLPAALRAAEIWPKERRVRDEDLALFIDHQGLDDNGMLDEALKVKVAASEFLFVFVGISYPRSKVCGEEFRWFVEAYQDEKTALDRTFIIVLDDGAKKQQWRALEAYRDGKYWFDFSDGSRPAPQVLKVQFQDEMQPNPEFETKLTEVIGAAVARIRKIAVPPPETQRNGTGPRRIVIGAVTRDLEPYRTKLRSALCQSFLAPDFAVEFLDEKDEKVDFDELDREDIAKKLAGADVAILPYSNAKVRRRDFAAGGHLALQEGASGSAPVVWLRGPDVGEVGPGGPEGRSDHLEYLQRISQAQPPCSIEEVVDQVRRTLTGDTGGLTAKLIWETHDKVKQHRHKMIRDFVERKWGEIDTCRALQLINRGYKLDTILKRENDLPSADGLILLAFGKSWKEFEELRDTIHGIIARKGARIEERALAIDKEEETLAYTPPPLTFRFQTVGGAETVDVVEESDLREFFDKVCRLARQRTRAAPGPNRTADRADG